jgi:membrane protein DedA with SNARE-associated domain
MTDLLTHAHYLGIILVLILTGSGLPIPEEVPVIWAGVASKTGDLDPWLALASCLIGAMLGDHVMYFVGRHFGRSVLREHPWFARFIKPEQEAQIEQMLRKHGLKLFFLTRFLVGFRSPVYLAAGILRVPFRRFFFADALSATVVLGTVFALAYAYGEHIGKLVKETQYLVTAGVILAVAIAFLVWWRRHRRRIAASLREAVAKDPPEPVETE